MRALIAAWVITIAAAGGGFYWLSTVEVPAAPKQAAETTTTTGEPAALSTGPIEVNVEEPAEEDCLGSC